MWSQRTKLPERNLDVLRALAVSLVVGFHLTLTAGARTASASLLARSGVILFFVHTSLVLMSSIERRGETPRWVRDFYTRRAFRIYPLAIVAVLLVLLLRISPRVPVAGIVFDFDPATVSELFANITLTQNLFGIRDLLGVLWSLPLEIQMYVLLPGCFLAARRGLLPVAGLVVFSLVVALLFSADAVRGIWRLSILGFAPCFAAGVVAYALMRHLPNRAKLPARWFLVFLPGSVLLLLLPVIRHNAIAGGWLVALVTGVTLPFFGELPPSVGTRVAASVAKYSYGIYLLHGPAAWVAFVFFRHQVLPLQVGVYAATLIVLPVVAFHAIESPFVEFGKRVVAPRAQAQTVGALT